MNKSVLALVASSALISLSACTAEEDVAVENELMAEEAPAVETLPVEDMSANEISTDPVEEEGLTNETASTVEGDMAL